jgi:hypothetical protein
LLISTVFYKYRSFFFELKKVLITSKTETQLANFFREYLRMTKGSGETTAPQDWSTAFSYLTDYLLEVSAHSEKKRVIFIDEMPWLDRPRSGFIPALEYFWNQHGSKMNNLLLIACGSVASWMQQKLLKSKGGLYNRVTQRMKLEPFNLHETELFCKKKRLRFTRYQILRLYMVMGGIPFYLNELYTGKSVDQLIEEICFSPNGLLSEEYEQLYFSLFKNAENHIAIVEALAAAPYGMGRKQLLLASGIAEGGTFTRTLKALVESGFVMKFRPFKKKHKDSMYRLIDMYSLFYLRFIKNNVSASPNTWQQLSQEGKFTAWSGYAYENICLLHTEQLLKKLGLHGSVVDISSWYYRAWYYRGSDEMAGSQIDLLIDRRDGFINICEAKFSNKEFLISKEYAANLRRKRAVFQHITNTKKSIVTTLITTYPAIENKYYLEEIHSVVTMDDLFEA